MPKSLIKEDRVSKNVSFARRYLVSNGYNQEKAQQVIDSIRHDIPNVRLAQYKFILGVTRMYLDNQLQSGREISELNKTLKYVASEAHVNEYDYNLNNESLQTIIDRFKGVAKNDLESEIEQSNARKYTVNEAYKIAAIDTPEEAAKYGKYTSWCVTHDNNMYNSYTSNGSGRFYFCLHKGFETEPKVQGSNSPLDSYGLSMIAVSVDMEGAVNTITCRWNHDMGGNDSVMTVEQLEQVIGRNFYQTFKPYSREELHAKGVILFDEVQELLDSGKKPEEIFDYVGSFYGGFAKVRLNGKYNFINTEGNLVSNQWFDNVGSFKEGFAVVQLNGKSNFINQEGKYISSQWYDSVSVFFYGFARVGLNNKYNFINQEGKLLSSQWYDSVGDFSEGFARVGLNNKYNFINQEGNLLSNQWFDYVGYFKEGFAVVQLNDKWNFIDTEGKLISNQWYDYVYNFSDGFAPVQLIYKWNFINQEGKLLSNQWYDYVYNFSDGFARVGLNNKVHIINTRGEIVESKKSNKTIIITEKQKKKLKKAIAAQDQVGGKVNAGVMDAVVGGMCESTNNSNQKIKLNESPDVIEYYSDRFSDDDAYPFICLLKQPQIYIGYAGQTHGDLVKEIDESLAQEFNDNKYEETCDVELTGRYWKKHNVISFWKTPVNKRLNIRKVIDAFKEKGIIQNSNYTLIDYWDNNLYSICLFPVKWFFNGTYDMFAGRCIRIAPIKAKEYEETGRYTYFEVTTNNSGVQCVNLNGDEILTGLQYYMKNYSMNENIENEAKWNGEGEELSFKKIKNIPQILYHASLRKNRDNILRNGIYASVGDEYKDWWNYEGPNGEIPDDEELPEVVFLTSQPNTWSDTNYLDTMDIYKVDTSKLDKNLFYLDPDRSLRLKGCYCYEGNIPVSAIELYDTVYRGKSVKYMNENIENEITSDEVDLSSFNIKKKLNPDFWVDGHLDSRIRMKLLDIAEDFINDLNIKIKPVDIIMTGSLANFNWSKKYSDIDLHILYDFSEIDDNIEFIKKYFDGQKSLWNQKHKDLTIYGFNVEVYVQDADEKHHASGIYSIEKDKWLIEPDRENLTASKVNKEYIKQLTSEIATKIDELEYDFKKTKDDEYKIRKIHEKAEKLFNEIKLMRKIGFEKSGGKEISNKNIVFKWLRRYGYIEKLSLLKTKCYDILAGI